MFFGLAQLSVYFLAAISNHFVYYRHDAVYYSLLYSFEHFEVQL